MPRSPRHLRRDPDAGSQKGPVVVKGSQVRCTICGHRVFWEHHIQLHTPLLSFLNWEWVNQTIQGAVCSSCGYIHWFVTERD